MNKLEEHLKTLTDLTVQFGFGREEAVKLIKNLLSQYKISFADLYPDTAARFDKMRELCDGLQKESSILWQQINPRSENTDENALSKGFVLPLEVVYEGGVRSKQIISGRLPVGVIVYGNKLLYWQESGEALTGSQAEKYIRRLPGGYNWHLMNEREACSIRDILNKVNDCLKAIGGDVIGSRNYMLADDLQSEGIIRYVADI